MLNIEIVGLPETIKAVDDLLSKRYVRHGLERAYPGIRDIVQQRYDQIAATTTYSPRSYGKHKRSGQVIPDNQFGKDTGALYNDLTTLQEIDQDTLTIYSDRAYAELFDALLERKGVEGGLLGIDDTALEPLEAAIAAEVEQFWRQT